MFIIPAIDLKNGKCVRLVQGKAEDETIYNDDPVAQARIFEDAGAQLIHVVDLDGAFNGKPANHEIIAEIARSVKTPIEVGGGIRTRESIDLYVQKGIRRVVIGTALLDPAFETVIARYKDVIISGVDARDGKVATNGWVNVSKIDAVEFIGKMKSLGLNEFIFTDIATDGMLGGPNIPSLTAILDAVPDIALIASGGVSSMSDLEALDAFTGKGIKGAIVGKAIYDGKIDIRAAAKKFI